MKEEKQQATSFLTSILGVCGLVSSAWFLYKVGENKRPIAKSSKQLAAKQQDIPRLEETNGHLTSGADSPWPLTRGFFAALFLEDASSSDNGSCISIDRAPE